MLSRLVIAFLPRSKRLLISWLQSPSAVILEPPKIKSVTVSIVSPSICHEVMEPDAMILGFWMLSFKPTFSLSSFTFIKRLFSSSLSAIRAMSSAYLRLLIFLPAILIPACASSSSVSHRGTNIWQFTFYDIYNIDLYIENIYSYYCISLYESISHEYTCILISNSESVSWVIWVLLAFPFMGYFFIVSFAHFVLLGLLHFFYWFVYIISFTYSGH